MKRGRSLINNKNRVGPRIEHCGTPDSRETLSVDYCFLPITKIRCNPGHRFAVKSIVNEFLNQNRVINDVESFFF